MSGKIVDVTDMMMYAHYLELFLLIYNLINLLSLRIIIEPEYFFYFSLDCYSQYHVINESR